MKLTRKEVIAEVKKAWNGTNTIDGIKICHVGWLDMGRMVIENEETFEEATKEGFIPIQHFRNQKEMVDSIYRMVNDDNTSETNSELNASEDNAWKKMQERSTNTLALFLYDMKDEIIKDGLLPTIDEVIKRLNNIK